MIRKVIFWTHLVVGIIAGIVTLNLCVTGALLSFEEQTVDWAESSPLALPPAGMTEHLPLDELLDNVAKVESSRPYNIRITNDPRSPVRIHFANRTILCANSYTGAVIGRGATSLRDFYRRVRNLHVDLLPSGDAKMGYTIVNVCNLAFTFLALSGIYLWWPRKWHWRALRSLIAIRFDVGGKQRDWNWHNAFGFWALIPLLFISASGVVLSYNGVNQAMLRFAQKYGSAPAAAPRLSSPIATMPKPGWPQILAVVEQSVPRWRSMNINWPGPAGTNVSILVWEGAGGEAMKMDFVNVDRATGSITQLKKWQNRDTGERARAIARLGHTGQILGLAGQVLACLACLAGVLLVYTGIALSWRRFFGRKRSGLVIANPSLLQEAGAGSLETVIVAPETGPD